MLSRSPLSWQAEEFHTLVHSFLGRLTESEKTLKYGVFPEEEAAVQECQTQLQVGASPHQPPPQVGSSFAPGPPTLGSAGPSQPLLGCGIPTARHGMLGATTERWGMLSPATPRARGLGLQMP